MGDLATAQAQLHRWDELERDPALRDLPYKIALNAWGKVERSPASNRHGRLQAFVAAELLRQLPAGIAISECSILTRIGIRVPDVAWLSHDFLAAYGEITPFMRAPEKISAYLAAGAKEVWIVEEAGAIRYFDASGEQSESASGVGITLPPPAKGTA